MLRHALASFEHADYRLYVGCYPNDPATISAVEAVEAIDRRVRPVIAFGPGPTKADCLNALWFALQADERARGERAKCIVLHDSEDIVHSGELRLFDLMIETFDLVQIPVMPLVDRGSRWISGHYLDEFAEHHGKLLVVREAIGAGLPLAGVGCAIARDALDAMAAAHGGVPFDPTSLTEDYEIGLRICETGRCAAFVTVAAPGKLGMVAVRAYFPATRKAAVRQKARWMAGIALAGWDRLGWRRGFAENWMRSRDRRVLLGAIVLLAAYAALLLWGLVFAIWLSTGYSYRQPSDLLGVLLWINSGLLLWRLLFRFAFVRRTYGWREGLRAVPRAVVANIIAMMAARRAFGIYWVGRSNKGAMVWEKTHHAFPEIMPAE